ncbi:MAG: hypothetical protein ABRQ39_26535 [Candidatus Eremiobacterota bacterium]
MEKEFYTEEIPFTESIYINTLIKLACDVIENKKNIRELKELCNILECLCKKLIVLHENLFHIPPEEPVKEFLEQFYKIIQEINKYSEHKNNVILREDIKNIIAVTKTLFESLNKLKEKPLPVYSKSPLLNELIIAAEEIINEIPGEKLTSAMEAPEKEGVKKFSSKNISSEKRLEEKINFLIEFTEATERQICSLDCDTVTLVKEYPVIRENLSIFKEGLEETGLYFQDRQKEHIEKGIHMAAGAAENLFCSLGLLYEASDIITKIICLKCGHKNSSHGSYCAMCRTLLPGAVPSDEKYEIKNFEYIITDNFNNLLEGARKIEYGEISDSEFIDILDSMEEKLAHSRFNFNLIQNKNGIIDEIFLYVEEYLKNIENGIKQMRLYKEKPEYLDKGLGAVFEASKILNEIQLLAIEAEREITARKGKIYHV